MNTKILTEVFSETDLTYIQQLDERQRRLYCATRAINIGKHGVAAVCASIHISKNTIYRGIPKYNPIKYKLFAHITRSWSGVPLLSAEYACKKANETTTSKGLVVVASINSKEYQTQRTLDESYVSERQKRIIFDEQLPKWNYVVRCKSA